MNEIKVYKNNARTVKWKSSTGYDFTGATCFLTVAKTKISDMIFDVEGTINTDTLIFDIPFTDNNILEGTYKFDITVIIGNKPYTLIVGDYKIIDSIKY